MFYFCEICQDLPADFVDYVQKWRFKYVVLKESQKKV